MELTAGAHTLTLSARDPALGATKGDAIIDRIDLVLRDTHVTAPALYEAAYASLGAGAHVTYEHRGACGPGAALLPRGGTATFWAHATTDGEALVTVDQLDAGDGVLTVNGEEMGASTGAGSHCSSPAASTS